MPFLASARAHDIRSARTIAEWIPPVRLSTLTRLRPRRTPKPPSVRPASAARIMRARMRPRRAAGGGAKGMTHSSNPPKLPCQGTTG
jgi:hypothetical protein